MQADGTILIDTTISDDGFKAGAKDVELAARRMAKTVGDIGDKAKQALEKQVDSFSKLNAQYAEQEKKVNSLKEKVEEFASQKVPTQEFVDIQKQITETEKKLAALNDRKEKFLATGGKTKSRTFAAMQYDIEQLKKTLAYAKAEKEALEKSGDWYVSGFNTEAGQKAAAQLKAEQQKLFEMNGRLNESFSSLKEKVASYGESLDDTSERVSRASGAFSAVKNGVAAVGKAALSTAKALAKISISAAKVLGNLTKMVGQKMLGGFVKLSAGIYGIHKSTNKSVLSLKNLIKYGLGIRSLFALFNKLRSAITDGFKNLAQYSSGTNKDISSLMSSLTQLKNSFATAFAPILSAVAPALNYLIGLLNAAVTAIAQFMAALTGKSTVVKATKVQQDYAKSLQKTGSAAKKAAGELASFDKLNVKKDDSSSGSGGGSVSPSQMFETTPIENSIKGMADKIRSLIKAQDWSGLGEYLAQGINVGLQKVYDAINWDHVGPKITAFVNAFTQTFNSLVSNIDWDLLGRTIGAGVNTIVRTLNLLADGIDWQLLGSKLAEGANGLVDEINWANLGKLFVAKFNIISKSLLGFVTTFNWSNFGKSIGKGINGAISSIDLKSSLNAMAGLAKGLLDALSNALLEVDWQAAGEKIKEGIVSIDYAGIAESLFNALGVALGSLGEFLYGLFHDGLDSMKSYFTAYAEEYGGDWAKGIYAGIINAFANVGAWIVEHVFNPFINGFKAAFGIHSPSTVMAEMGGYLIEGLKEGITKMFPGLTETIEELKKIFNGLITFVSGVFSGEWGKAWEGVKEVFKGVFNSIISIAENAVNYIARSLNKVSFDVPDWVPEIGGKTFGFQVQEVRLPRLASGTVVPPRAGEFAAILGDNKKETEVVSPLSTMKQALKEALQEVGGLGGGDIVGYIYLDGKEMGASTVKFIRQEKKRTGKNPVLV